VHVVDNGSGIPAPMLAAIFDMFVQVDRGGDHSQGGLGIGLTLVRTLVKMHGGSVRAFSKGPGDGSELVVRLPLQPRAAQVPAAAATPGPRDGTAAPLRVLIVDDNVDAAATVGRVMELLGHQVALAHDGPAALAAAAATPPDLILLDIGLPEMEGYEVASRLRAAGHTRATLVAVTGYGRENDVQRSRDAGFDHHLVKPVDLAQLRKLTDDLRGRRIS